MRKWSLLTTTLAVVVGAFYDEAFGITAWPFPLRLALAAALGALVHVIGTKLGKALKKP
jgi:hypothetical protein